MSSVLRTIVKKKSVFLVLLFVVVGFVFSAQGASAGDCSLLTGNIDGCVSSLLLWVLEGFVAVLAYIAQITNWAMQPSPITSSYFVQEGWKATRDFANMFFILILLAIALDFILFNSFGVKRALPKLLIIALLINFSIPLAGILLDFANIVASFFLAQVSQGGFTENVAQSVGLSRVFDTNTFRVGATDVLTAEKIGGNTFINILFAIGMVIGMMFIFLALALMFLIRTGYISVLLILLPIALVLSAFPPTSNHFSKWMSKFTQWTMFAPAAAFFLYLSMLVLTATNSQGTPELLSMGGGTAIAKDSPAFTFLRYIMAWGLMLMSLTVAQSMGITTAGAALATWKKGTKWARGKAGGVVKTTAAAAGRRMGADKSLEGLAKGLQKLPMLGGILASGTRGIAAKTKAAMEKQEALTSAEKTKLEGLSNEALKQEMKVWEKSKLPGSDVKAAQIYEMLMKRGEHVEKNADGTPNTDATNERAIKAYAVAKRHGNKDMMKNIRKANPDAWQTIAENEWKEEISKGNIVKDAKGAMRNKITGKTLEDTKNRAFEEMTSADFENLKGTWRDETVKRFLESGSMSQSHLRMANNAGDGHFIESVGRALSEREAIEKLKKENRAFFNYLKSGGAHDYYGINIPDSVLKDIGEESDKKGEKKEGGKRDVAKEIDEKTKQYEG